MLRGPLTGPLAGVFLLLGLSACSTAPFPVKGSDDAAVEAEEQKANLLPRLQPYAFGLCYNPAFDDEQQIAEEAAYECDGGRLERKDEDFFWNGCSISQPHRVSFVCFPPDKAKRRTSTEPQPQ